MQFQLNDPDYYALSPSPFKTTIDALIVTLCHDALKNSDTHKKSVEDALYFSVRKRMIERSYKEDEQDYLLGLISDIEQAEYEFSQVCYSSEVADDTFSTLRSIVLSLIKS